MSKKFDKKPLAVALGSAVVASLSTSVANAEANPFGMSELSTGYMMVAQAEGEKGGEMKCGASMMKKGEGSCGEGKCGAGMMKPQPKVGEGKCAGQKKADEGTSEAPAGEEGKAE